jgi:hypothetical protein
LRRQSIEARKHRLAALLRGVHSTIVLNDHYEGDGAIIFKQACKRGCEGIVSKRLGSAYKSGRSPHWVKVKIPRRRRSGEKPRRIGPLVASEPRRFPPPWSVEERPACFIVSDANGQGLAHVYYEEESGRRTAAKRMTQDEARRIAVKIAKLPGLLRR